MLSDEEACHTAFALKVSNRRWWRAESCV